MMIVSNAINEEGVECDAFNVSLVKVLNDLKRSEPHRQIMLDLELVIGILEGAHVRQIDLLPSIFDQSLSIGSCINIDLASISKALACQDRLGLATQDSIIYATIVSDIQQTLGACNKVFFTPMW